MTPGVERDKYTNFLLKLSLTFMIAEFLEFSSRLRFLTEHNVSDTQNYLTLVNKEELKSNIF